MEQYVLVNINITIEVYHTHRKLDYSMVLGVIISQNDRVVGELSVSGLCIKEPKPSGDFSSNYILTVR